jgi:hypothetical protein
MISDDNAVILLKTGVGGKEGCVWWTTSCWHIILPVAGIIDLQILAFGG